MTNLSSLIPTKTIPATLRRLGLLPLAAASIACGGGDFSALETRSANSPAAPVEVRLATAELESRPLVTRATGSIEPLRRVSPGTKILGRLDRVTVTEGDRVAAGALLAQLEDRDLQAAVGQADASVRMAEAQLENARAQRARMEELHGRGSVTDKNLEDAVAAFRVATAALDQAKANVAAAQVALSYAEIASPIGGWVVAKHVEAGDMATPGTPLFTIEDLSKVKVHVQVPEADVVGLEVGAAARVTVLERDYLATIDRIVPAGDPASRTFSVKLLLDNADGLLKSGMYVRSSFARGERRLLRVDDADLVERGQLKGLFVTGNDGRLSLRWVKTGRSEDGRTEILSGLEPGERYVVAPAPDLRDGVAIREGA